MEPVDVGFDPNTGLVPAIVQSVEDGSVRMLGYMDREALGRTLASGRVTFYSRSRKELWEKGAISGHWLELVEIRPDCDRDALLVRAVPHGPTCHTGASSCFEADGRIEGAAAPGRDVEGGAGLDPEDPAGSGPPTTDLGEALRRLEEVVARRDRMRPEASHTAALLGAGSEACARKVGEEAVETVVSALSGDGRLSEESADLLYHLVVLWRAAGVSPAEVAEVLSRRRAGGEEGG